MSPFIARTVFPTLQNLPRSYFLGHHAKALQSMKRMLSLVDVIIECRDYRVPLTSRNPLFEESLAGKQRLIVYTKKDLGSNGTSADRRREAIVEKWHSPSRVLFIDTASKRDIQSILQYTRALTSSRHSVTGTRMMVVGMPNVGKSSVLNALRSVSLGKGKAARTGDQPGVTRKLASSVKIIDGKDGSWDSVYLLDTPGVFVTYVPDPEAMLKLALCGSVKDSVIPYVTLADYCLYRVNLRDPSAYSHYCEPTNGVLDLLDAVARQTGRLMPGGKANLESAALWFIQQWRRGKMGKFGLDDVTEDALENTKAMESSRKPSMSQALKLSKMDLIRRPT